MKRLFPRSRAAAARQLTRTSADCWRPPAATPPPAAARFSTSRSRVSATVAADPIVQAMPRGAYYDVLLTNPPPYGSASAAHPESQQPQQPQQQTQTAAAAVEPPQPWAPRTTQERAAIVFGSRLAGPMERENRLAAIRKRSTSVAGVLVPPKPGEPDNCCMSGCVNCVWDRFRDEMEEWATASAEASRRLRAREAPRVPSPTSVSMDDDGGGSNTNWSLEEVGASSKGGSGGWDEELYKSVPVGIREFMKQEKRLKLKHMQDGTAGG